MPCDISGTNIPLHNFMRFGHYLDLIAQANVGPAIITPLLPAQSLSERLGQDILLKMEIFQPVLSFKLRGAYNKMASLTAAERARGVITASAGNHAQGVSLAAANLGVAATIVMPRTTPDVKIRAVRRLNPKAHVVLYGEIFPEALQKAREMETQSGLVFIHPYDDRHVIAGQGTIGREILQQAGNHPIHAIFVPVGGGGLIAGVAAYVKQMAPHIQIIGVEPEDSDCLYQALRLGEQVTLPQVGRFADGVAVARIGDEPFRIAQSCVDHVLRVSHDEICAAAHAVYKTCHVFPEAAGALALAGIQHYTQHHSPAAHSGAVVGIISGANVDADRIRYMTERATMIRTLKEESTMVNTASNLGLAQ